MRIGFAMFLISLAAVGPANAQFDDVRSKKEEKAAAALQKTQAKCREGDGRACYQLAELVSTRHVAVTGDPSLVKWALVEESCKKGYQTACDEIAEKRRADAEAARLAVARRAEEARLAAARTVDGPAAELERKSTVGGFLKTALIVGSGVAAGAAAGEQASEAERSQMIADAMAAAADLVGERDAAAAFRGASPAGSPSVSAATAGNSNGDATPKYSGTGLTGTWSYTGRFALHVRHMLSKVTNWKCPAGPNDSGVTPQLAVRPSSQRDQYVAAAVMGAFALECYARQGEPEKGARLVEPRMGELFRDAEALCSGATAVPGRSAPATLYIWGCPAPYR